MKSYSEMVKLKTFDERFEYLKLDGTVGEIGFGHDRHLNQQFYKSQKWLEARDRAIIRDEACDLAMEGENIVDMVIVHHINPVTREQLLTDDPILYDLENLVCCRQVTHQAIHYGDASLLPQPYVERRPNDTVPWK